MRAGEVCGLTWDCVNLDKKQISVEKILIFKTKQGYDFSSPKTSNSIRTIEIGDTLVKILEEHKKWQEKIRKYIKSLKKLATDLKKTVASGWQNPKIL